MIQPLWRTEWKVLKKLEMKLSYSPAIPLLVIFPEKTIIEKDTCTAMFIAALFTIARTWNLENPRDGRVWWAAIYGVAQSQTRLK